MSGGGGWGGAPFAGLYTHELVGHTKKVHVAKFSCDGRRIASGGMCVRASARDA